MSELGKLIKQRRMVMSLTLRELANASDVSASHLSRIERGGRLPSAHTLRRIARPLTFEEEELFTLANYMSPVPAEDINEKSGNTWGLDPYVARALAEESLEVQRAAFEIISILKSLVRGIKRAEPYW